MTSALLLAVSGAVALVVIALLRKERALQYGVFLIYSVWHLPLILTTTMPFSVGFASPLNAPYIALILMMVHIIVGGGIVGMKSVAARRRRPQPDYRLTFGAATWCLAWSTPLLLGIDAFVFRGVRLTTDLGANRAAFSSGDVSILGQLGVLLAGVALYMLMARPVTRGRYLLHALPFLVTTLLFLLMGNRQYMLQGLVIVTINVLADRRPTFLRVVVTGGVLAMVFAILMIQFGMHRQWQTEGVQDDALRGMLAIEVDDYDHPLARNYALRSGALYLYVYYGIELELAGVLMRTFPPSAPLTSLTVPIVYRRVSGRLGLPEQTAVTKDIADTIGTTLGVYPNVWRTMFSQVYMERGFAGVVVLTLILASAHFVLARRFVRRRRNGTLNGLIILYMFVVFGLMYIPTREASTLGLISFAVAVALLSSAVTTRAGSPEGVPEYQRDEPHPIADGGKA